MTKQDQKKLYKYFKKVAYFWTGVSFIFIGLIGLIFPVMPGILPIFFGLGLVKRSQHEYSKHRIIRFLNELKTKFQKRFQNRKGKKLGK
ncbi:MAG: hypothetical protein U9Q85_00065 [Patescibacteria group bacterium]|nr:hypothetical protein [Patescibacteria group bacterium]